MGAARTPTAKSGAVALSTFQIPVGFYDIDAVLNIIAPFSLVSNPCGFL